MVLTYSVPPFWQRWWPFPKPPPGLRRSSLCPCSPKKTKNACHFVGRCAKLALDNFCVELRRGAQNKTNVSQTGGGLLKPSRKKGAESTSFSRFAQKSQRSVFLFFFFSFWPFWECGSVSSFFSCAPLGCAPCVKAICWALLLVSVMKQFTSLFHHFVRKRRRFKRALGFCGG